MSILSDPSWLVLDPEAGPLAQQIHDGVQTQILNGRLRAGDILPSSRTLATALGIARSTVMLGYERLRAAGYIVAAPGSATRVASLPSIPEGAQTTRRTLLTPEEKPAPPLPFQPGIPDLTSFPAKVWARCMGVRARDLRLHDLGYGEALGLKALRCAIISHVTRARGVLAHPDQVLIMPSTAAILDFLARLTLAQRRTVWLEEPGYVKAREIFQAHNARIVPVSCDGKGIVVPNTFNDAPALIYVTPSHQYPTGVTMSLSRRMALLEVAHRSDSLIIEDDYDSEFHYDGRPIAALQGIDRHDHVAYTGTFSKTLAPGIRVAYAILPPGLMEEVRPIVERIGGSVPIHMQAALADFIRDGHFRAHIRRMKDIYQARMVATRSVLATHFEVGAGQGGLQLAAWCRDSTTDDRALVAFLREAGIGVRALSGFYMGPPRKGIVASIANATPQNLANAKTVLERVFHSD